MSRRAVIGAVCLLAGLLVAAVLWIERRPPPPQAAETETEHSLDELVDGVFEVDPDHWHSFYNQARPVKTGWIALPPQGAPHRAMEINSTQPAVVDGQVCGECHADKLQGFLQTAHHLTSRLATRDSVLGAFEDGRNRLRTSDPALSFLMDRSGKNYRQRVLVERDGKTYSHAALLDLVTGSGNHAQTYLYWQDDALYQLPVSWLSESQQWVYSPGFYENGTADFARPITSRCLECHATYVENITGTTNRYVPSLMSLGVSCVRCHGPGEPHVAWHRAHPDEQEGRDIVHPGKLPRDRANEICAQCHAGIGQSLQPPFSYRPGEPLDAYIKVEQKGEEIEGGVHTDNQLVRLAMSRCFQASEKMTCATCHDPHQPEHGRQEVFAARCRSCHDQDRCQVFAEVGAAIHDRCVDCHMPKRRDREMKFATDAGMINLLMLRDHNIREWPEASAAVLQELRNSAPADSSVPTEPSR
jgi:hypothetical protein